MTEQEQIERAILRLWPMYIQGQPWMLGCNVCDSRPTYFKVQKSYEHTEDCVIPRLVLKYGWYDLIPDWNPATRGFA